MHNTNKPIISSNKAKKMSVMGAAIGCLKRSGSGIGKLGLLGQVYNFWRVDSRSEACRLVAKVWGSEGTLDTGSVTKTI